MLGLGLGLGLVPALDSHVIEDGSSKLVQPELMIGPVRLMTERVKLVIAPLTFIADLARLLVESVVRSVEYRSLARS